MKYRKYKPLTAPRKCNRCEQKAIKAAYRTLCGQCARSADVCAGCGRERLTNIEDAQTPGELQREENEMREVMRGLSERQRRAVSRSVERGEDKVEVISKMFGESNENSEEGASGDEDDDGDAVRCD